MTHWLVVLLVALSSATAQVTSLGVSEDGHNLVTRDGKPFFYLADTAWELLARLNRDEAIRYLDDRKTKGFTVIQTAFLALYEGPNALGQVPVNYARLRPITKQGNASASTPADWWDHADFILQEATARGFYIAIAPFRQQLVPKKKADAVRYAAFWVGATAGSPTSSGRWVSTRPSSRLMLSRPFTVPWRGALPKAYRVRQTTGRYL